MTVKEARQNFTWSGNSISKVCPYFSAWGLDGIFRTIKQGEIRTKTIETENTSVKLAVEFCGKSGGKSVTIGSASAMIDGRSMANNPTTKTSKKQK